MFKRLHHYHRHSHPHTDRDILETFPLFLRLPWQWEAWKFFAPVLHVLESCAFGPGLVGSRRAQCVLLTQAPAVLRCPCMALESCQALRGCLHGWGRVRGWWWGEGGRRCYHRAAPNILLPFPHDSPPDINHFPGLADDNSMLGKMLLWIIRLIAINSVKWCANERGSCFPHSALCKG